MCRGPTRGGARRARAGTAGSRAGSGRARGPSVRPTEPVAFTLVDDTRRADYEQRFRRAGLPLLIEGFSAREDVFTRAYPLLALVFTVEVLGALNLEWSALANVAAVAGAVTVMLAGVARGQPGRGPARAGRSRARSARWSSGVFVVAALGAAGALRRAGHQRARDGRRQYGAARPDLPGDRLGFVSIVRWAGRRLAGQLASSLLLLARAVPLLLLFAVVLFINTEMWQTFGAIDDPALIAFAGLLIGIGTLFLAVRLPQGGRAARARGRHGPAARARPAGQRRARDVRQSGAAGAARQRGDGRVLRRARPARDHARRSSTPGPAPAVRSWPRSTSWASTRA